MNYKKEMLESKIFNFSKRLLHNLLLAGCVALLTALLVVHFSNCAISVVLSDSMLPNIKTGDYLLVQEKSDYKVGDIVQFEDVVTGLNITHRIIAVKTEEDKTFFVCCGDSEELLENDYSKQENSTENWQKNAHLVDNLSLHEIDSEYNEFVQIVELKNIQGKVIEKLKVISVLIGFVKRNWIYLLIILLLISQCFKNLSVIEENASFNTLD